MIAFKEFPCTQYIRHHSSPFFTPEVDIVHELFGHMPMLADPGFADMVQEIGLTSLNANESQIKQLANIYYHIIEFGVYEKEEKIKIFGAGVLAGV